MFPGAGPLRLGEESKPFNHMFSYFTTEEEDQLWLRTIRVYGTGIYGADGYEQIQTVSLRTLPRLPPGRISHTQFPCRASWRSSEAAQL
jgi:hypothetical protein